MKKSWRWSLWFLGFSILGIGTDVKAVNIYLRSGTTTCIYNTNVSQTLQMTSGTNQASIAFSAKTNTFSFYSAAFTKSAYISSSKTATGTMGVQNNGTADFQSQVRETLYDYNPATGSQVQIVAGSASGWVTVSKNGNTGKASLPGKSVGGSGYTIPAGHMLKTVVTVVVNISSGINGAFIYNAGSGNGKSLVQFPRTGSFTWPFGNFTTPPDATIIAPTSVTKNSTGNIASVRDAGTGAAYSWTITNGIITAGQSTRQITWTAGSAGSVDLGVVIVNGCVSSGSASVITLTVKTNQTVTFNPIPTYTYGDASFTLSATASSGLPVTFTIVSGPATVSGSTLMITGAGTIIVDAMQAGNTDYNPAITEQSFTVNPKTLTVSGITANDKVYDGTTDAALDTNSATLTGVLAGDVVTLDTTSVSGDFADETVGSGKTVNISGLDLVGADEGNYTLADPTTTADITAAELTVSGIAANDKVYDGTTTATLNTGSTTLVGVFSNDVVTLNTDSAAGTFATGNVGPAKVVTISGLTLSGADAGNYTLTQPTAAANITVRALAVSAMAANKVYDGTTAAAVTLSDNRVAGDNLGTSYATASFSDKNVGNGKTVSVNGISISGTDAGNYSFNTTANATANITAATLTINAAANSKTYDGTTSAAAIPTASGLQGSDSVTGLTETYDAKNVGTGKTLSVSAYTVNDGNSGNNYTVSTVANAAGVISRATLTITAAPNTKTYDSTTSAAAIPTASGLQGSDSVTGLTETYDTKNVGMGKTLSVSAYTVIDGNSGANYTVSTVASTEGVISQATLTITAAPNTKTYDSTISAAASPTASGLQGSDSVTGLAETYDTKNVGTGKTLSVSAYSVNDGNSGNNYTVSTVANTAGVIDPAALTITAAPNTKTYDGTTSAAAIPTVSGLQGSDSVTGLAEAYDTKDAGIGKTLSVSAYTVNDGNAGANYTVNTISTGNNANNANNGNSTAGVITPAPLTVTADNKSKICGQSNPPLTASYNGFVGGDNASALSSPAVLSTTATTTSGAGKYPITVGGAATANYTIQYANGTLTVISAPQLAGANVNANGTKQYVVSWPTVTGQTYQLEYKDNLSAATWTPLGNSVAGNDAMVSVTNNISASPHRFFRVQVQVQ